MQAQETHHWASGVHREIEEEQLENLRKTPPHILVGTAKRLLELVENHRLEFHRLNTLALDEADHLIKLPGKHAKIKKVINLKTNDSYISNAKARKSKLDNAIQEMRKMVFDIPFIKFK